MYLLKNKMNLTEDQGVYTMPKESDCHQAENQKKYIVHIKAPCIREKKKECLVIKIERLKYNLSTALKPNQQSEYLVCINFQKTF